MRLLFAGGPLRKVRPNIRTAPWVHQEAVRRRPYPTDIESAYSEQEIVEVTRMDAGQQTSQLRTTDQQSTGLRLFTVPNSYATLTIGQLDTVANHAETGLTPSRRCTPLLGHSRRLVINSIVHYSSTLRYSPPRFPLLRSLREARNARSDNTGPQQPLVGKSAA